MACHSKGTITQHACAVLVSLPSAALSRPSVAAALGFGGLHCINETGHKYKSRRGKNSAGAEKWLDLNFWSNTTDCLQHAKNAGYQVTPGVLLCSPPYPETSASKWEPGCDVRICLITCLPATIWGCTGHVASLHLPEPQAPMCN